MLVSGRLAYVQRALVRRLGEMGDGRVLDAWRWRISWIYLVRRSTALFGTCYGCIWYVLVAELGMKVPYVLCVVGWCGGCVLLLRARVDFFFFSFQQR